MARNGAGTPARLQATSNLKSLLIQRRQAPSLNHQPFRP